MPNLPTEGAGSKTAFPPTRWTRILDAGDPTSPTSRKSFEELANLYWRPVYAYFRRRWSKSHEDARDLTQDFFVKLCNEKILDRVRSGEARFRTYVKTVLDNYVKRQFRDGQRLKRGGGALHLQIDDSEFYQPTDSLTPDQVFEQEWARTILERAMADLRKEYESQKDSLPLKLFLMRDVDRPKDQDLSYQGLAETFGISTADVTNHLHRARKKLRERVLKELRDTVTTDKEAESELRKLFGNP